MVPVADDVWFQLKTFVEYELSRRLMDENCQSAFERGRETSVITGSRNAGPRS